MPKSKLLLLLLSCLLLAAGAFYWQKKEAGQPPLISRSAMTPAAETAREEALSAGQQEPVDETKEENSQAVSETALEETTAPEWVFATEPLMVNINTADRAELEKLPGIGPGKAQAIIDYRQEHGPFQSVEELMRVPGIKEGTFGKLKDYVTV